MEGAWCIASPNHRLIFGLEGQAWVSELAGGLPRVCTLQAPGYARGQPHSSGRNGVRAMIARTARHTMSSWIVSNSEHCSSSLLACSSAVEEERGWKLVCRDAMKTRFAKTMAVGKIFKIGSIQELVPPSFPYLVLFSFLLLFFPPSILPNFSPSLLPFSSPFLSP